MRLGKRSYVFENPVYVLAGYSIVGPKEAEGNFGKEFDFCLTKDDLWDEESFEKCECKMHRESIKGAIQKSGVATEDIDLILAGDLLNEISASNFAAREFIIPFMGLYSACATFGEAVAIASIFLSNGVFETITCSTSSHFSSAERQYRFPLELGNQRTPTSQWTVTGSGCLVLSKKTRANLQNPKKAGTQNIDKLNGFEVKVTSTTIGRVIDMGMDDESDMGAAMAPAAADTLITHFKETKRAPSYYDAILTGDLGLHGKKLLHLIMDDEGYSLPDCYEDCGAVYFTDEQKCVQGGSGAGCSSTAFSSHYLNKLMRGELKKVLLVPTGALLNKDTPLQKETIPAIAHAVSFESFEMK